jgi:hypothetical protein
LSYELGTGPGSITLAEAIIQAAIEVAQLPDLMR